MGDLKGIIVFLIRILICIPVMVIGIIFFLCFIVDCYGWYWAIIPSIIAIGLFVRQLRDIIDETKNEIDMKNFMYCSVGVFFLIATICLCCVTWQNVKTNNQKTLYEVRLGDDNSLIRLSTSVTDVKDISKTLEAMKKEVAKFRGGRLSNDY